MADIIALLPDHVANQIAAGEVVQRPASVVKELLENALDAKASSIRLVIKEAGKTLIQVIDDGIGMSVTDARLSFERHATSKIKSADDLFQIASKGFRGEALASIAAVAHVELKTKLADDEVGTAIKIEGSEVKSQDAVATPKGTSVAVKNLFFNVPARRNFLKSNSVELRHIIDEFHRVALVHHDTAFSLYHNENELFNLPISNFRQRIVAIFGSKTNEKLVPVTEETEVLKIDGFVMKPEFAKKTKGDQYFFVNDRFIKSGYLNHAIQNAFEGLLRPKTQASYFLKLTVDPATIDINIHPTKTEIKFEDEHTMYALLRSAVKHSLGQFNIAPIIDFEQDPNLNTPYEYKDKGITAPKVDVNQHFNPFEEEVVSQRSTATRTYQTHKKETANWESLYVDLNPEPSEEHSQVSFESAVESTELFETNEIDHTAKRFQVLNKFVMQPMKNGLLVIDQSRAHQRILYESFLSDLTIEKGHSQQLLFPLELNFTMLEIAVLNEVSDLLKQSGFDFVLQEEHIAFTGIPASIEESQVSVIIESLVYDIQHQVPDSHFSQSDLIAKSMAKSAAIRSGVSLTAEEQAHLVNKLFACKEPETTVTGLKTFTILDKNDLEQRLSL
ncbi:MAG: DNA mismatch repair endonuclease MutL [bacterium]